MQRIRIIDSHTGGEPTRLVIGGFPDLGQGDMAERRRLLGERHDAWRAACILEPRGSDVLVGALLCAPVDPEACAGVIFFNNSGYLGMCGHGTIGLVASLAHLGRIGPGVHRIETPVGEVEATLHEDGSVSVRNVPAYRYRRQVSVEVPGIGRVSGDIAWGGNWFFLVAGHGQRIAGDNLDALTAYTVAVQQALEDQGIRGEDGGAIDHIELFADDPHADSRNFVLCPGKAYDRSPCGTGTSAKLACLAADGKLLPGQPWRQASVIGSQFEGRYEWLDGQPGGRIVPTIRGRARQRGSHPAAGGRRSVRLGHPPVNAEVIVVGAGIVGSACAHELARRGLDVLVLDSRRGGATAVGMGHLVAMDDNPAELALSDYSIQAWRAWAADLPEDCAYRNCGTLWLAADASELAEAERKRQALQAAGVACRMLGAARLYALEPALRPGLAGALEVSGDGILYAPNAARWLLDQAGPRLPAVRRSQRSGRQPPAPGRRPLAERRGAGAGQRHPCRRAVRGAADPPEERPPADHRPLSRHPPPSTGGTRLCQQRPRQQRYLGSLQRPAAPHRAGLPRLLAAVRHARPAGGRPGAGAHAAACPGPGLAGLNAIRAWTGFRAATPDGLPLLGEHPAQPGLWLAVGHEGLGVTTAPGSARLLAAQLFGETPPLDATPYLPQRFLSSSRSARP